MGTFPSAWQYPFPRSASLVLVFGPDGVLLRHNLVRDLRKAAPPPKDAAPAGQDPGH